MALDCVLPQYTLYWSAASCPRSKYSNLRLDQRVTMSGSICVVSQGSNSHIKAWHCLCFMVYNWRRISPCLPSSWLQFACSVLAPGRLTGWTRWEKTPINPRCDLVLPLHPIYPRPRPPPNYRCGELRDKQSRNNPITSNGHAHDGSIWGGRALNPSKAGSNYCSCVAVFTKRCFQGEFQSKACNIWRRKQLLSSS